MYKVEDLTDLNWGSTKGNGISYGCYFKAKSGDTYYKCSQYYSAIQKFGDESVYEVICSRLLRRLNLPCVDYKLISAKVRIDGSDYITYICKSKDFARGFDSKITLEELYLMNRGMTLTDFICKLGIQRDIEKMLMSDFLTLQRDRHGGNIELVRRGDVYYLAHLFDNGLGLLAPYPSCYDNDVSKFDVLADYPVNNYIGTRSLYDNLSLITRPIIVRRLRKEDRRVIFYNLTDVLPKSYLDKIWQLITYRYMYLRKRGFIYET